MTKISQLPSDSSPTTTDYVPTVDAETTTTKRSTLANLITLFFNNIPNLKITTASIQADAVTAAKIDWASTGADAGIWWEEVGRTTLAAAGDTISVTGIPARKYLKVIIFATATGGTISLQVRFNNDSGTNYARRASDNGGADGTNSSGTNIFSTAASSNPAYAWFEAINVAANEKQIWGGSIDPNTAGAGNAPGRSERIGKWANTSDQITRIDVLNLSGTGDFAIGSEVVVLGHN